MAADRPGSSQGDNVTALHGEVMQTGRPHEGCVKALRELLARAEAGEVVGIVCASLHSDNLASYTLAGLIGPYSLNGAIDLAHDELRDRMKAAQRGE